MTAQHNQVVRVYQTGGPDVLVPEFVSVPLPHTGEVLVRQEAIGANFIDTYFRSGLYKFPTLPAIPGMEGAGVVEAVGKGVVGLSAGMRVAYTGVLGGYAQYRLVPADRLVVLPDGISTETAAAVMLRGLSAHMLLWQVHRVRQGETILVYAPAGGVGQLLCQWGSYLGARVIGVTSSEHKADIARACGAADVLVGMDNLPERVRELTNGAMVPVVYDSIGRATFEASLSCLAPRGLMVSYGNASGPVTGVNVGTLAAKGSLYLTRPTLSSYIGARPALEAATQELFAMLEQGALRPTIGQRFALAEAHRAHEVLEAGGTIGSTILLP
ncbi:quinone oxidoreductase family protein [Acetobacter ghanensis]|uniref:NADPH2:quinone reductase n=1 Tax=Acetobacter ghanensis TaxID=431306 RepID=A0A0U5EZX6_9PROT|nr:quinone oxidoreductase [Acetobacter ghanensis]NHO39707.1 zinc-binding dehydrogenase [Acetobacter ghanensis]GBQ48983.1 zinc-dependent alcohol dehydrogenase [Acetobacter ghanensis DSM 18895]CEF53486.1 NADPH2:quinone reductase [Acetobacter ghanensis]